MMKQYAAFALMVITTKGTDVKVIHKMNSRNMWGWTQFGSV